MKTLYKLLAWIWLCFALAHLLGILFVVSDPFFSRQVSGTLYFWTSVVVFCSGILGLFILTGQPGSPVRLMAWLFCLYFPFGAVLAVFTLIASHHPENRDI